MSAASSQEGHQQTVLSLSQLTAAEDVNSEVDGDLGKGVFLIDDGRLVDFAGDLDVLDRVHPAKRRLQVEQVAQNSSWVLDCVLEEDRPHTDGGSSHTCWHTLLLALQLSQLAAPAAFMAQSILRGSSPVGSKPYSATVAHLAQEKLGMGRAAYREPACRRAAAV